jgi:hypothetical protein
MFANRPEEDSETDTQVGFDSGDCRRDVFAVAQTAWAFTTHNITP